MQNDYIQLFEQVYRAMNTHVFPESTMRPYKEYVKENTEATTMEMLKQEADEIYHQFYLQYSYKTQNESIDRK